MPSAVGYQPTLATEMGVMQERITSTKRGSITSVQAIYVPADDLTDPAPATTFAHLDATTVLSRKKMSDKEVSLARAYPDIEDLSLFQSVIDDICDELNVPCILNAFNLDMTDKYDYFYDHAHPVDKGNTAIAERVFEFVREDNRFSELLGN